MSDNRGSFWKGFGVAAAVTTGAVAFGGFTIGVGIGAVILLGLGIVQLAWALPMYIGYRRKGETETAKGVLLAAGITFLLNAGCWGYVGTVGFKPMH